MLLCLKSLQCEVGIEQRRDSTAFYFVLVHIFFWNISFIHYMISFSFFGFHQPESVQTPVQTTIQLFNVRKNSVSLHRMHMDESSKMQYTEFIFNLIFFIDMQIQ